jgi:uncharacterized protein (DUF433 family)
MNGFDRITFDPNVMGGQACIRTTGIPVSAILNLLANCKNKDEILAEYPDLEMVDIQQALGWAARATIDKHQIEMRLSADYLFHYTKRLDVIKNILRIGFRYYLIQEKIPYKETYQENFAICFCDLRIEDTVVHRKRYGNNSIVLSKEWGIKNCIQPVNYIHENSSVVSTKYIAMRSRFREIHQNHPHKDDVLQAMMDYLIFSRLLDKEKLNHEMIKIDIDENPNLPNEFAIHEQEFLEFMGDLERINRKVLCCEYIFSMFKRINDLHLELEKRDAFARIYFDNYSHKILYDEREWRAIKFTDDAFNVEENAARQITLYEYFNTKADENKDIAPTTRNEHLPDSENLIFSDDDIVAILVQDEKSVDEIKEFLSKPENQKLLNYEAVKDKIRSMDSFSEG